MKNSGPDCLICDDETHEIVSYGQMARSRPSTRWMTDGKMADAAEPYEDGEQEDSYGENPAIQPNAPYLTAIKAPRTATRRSEITQQLRQ